MKSRRLAPLLLLLMTATCAREDMFDQQREAPWSRSAFFRDHMTMRHPVAGTVARNAPDEAVPQPVVITAAMLARGQQRFGIDCVPCHGQAGDGRGTVVERGFPRPPALFSDDLIKARAQHFYDVITNGHGVMYSYADRVSPADRWAIIAYIRALQRSQRAQVASLPEQDQQALQAAGP
jgi:mono/diheme cytochrome c family protein